MQLPHGVNAPRETSTTARRRMSSYWILGVGLTVSYAVVRGSVWQGVRRVAHLPRTTWPSQKAK